MPGPAARVSQRHHVLELHGRRVRAQARPRREARRNLEGASTWAFEFEDQAPFPGFRALASFGIDHPVLNVFRMYAKMGGNRVPAVSSGAVPLDAIVAGGVRSNADVAALASVDGNRLCVMAWHYHDDDVAGPDAAVTLELAGLARQEGRLRVTHYRIDDAHGNAYADWMRMGSPIAPNGTQYAQLEAAGRLDALPAPPPLPVARGAATLQMGLPRQAVSLLVVEWES